jgi:hypothetical protein
VLREDFKHAKKLLDPLRRRFPKNPLFLVLAAETAVGLDARIYSVELLLNQAKKLAEASSEPRHRALLDRIARLRKEIDSPPFFDRFFDGFDED